MNDARRAADLSILYRRDGFDTSGQRLLGRQAAGEGFLRALFQHGARRTIGCLARTRAEFDDFTALAKRIGAGDRAFRFVNESSAADLATAGVLYRADPVLLDEAFRRRSLSGGSRSFSLCGVTHTISSKVALRGLADLLLAPVEPWDAVVCTSQSVKTAVEKLHASWGDYLKDRVGGTPGLPLRLPIIPLGIDWASFERREDARAGVRRLLGVEADDIVVLYVGRLIFYAKAHPSPMYLALERVTKKTGRRIHLVQAGWFENATEEQDFRATAAMLAPSVRHHFLDGRKVEVRRDVWSAADLFVSLSDNVQETFGLTPIEAMASGLPVVVSDWDGYRESVRDGVDGFCVPTLIPPPGAALTPAVEYSMENISHATYGAVTSMSTAVSVEAATAAIARLVEDGELRAKLGANGKRRAAEVYDWSVVIRAYEELWAELSAIRMAASTEGFSAKPGGPAIPLLDDPFRQFAHYATTVVSDDFEVVPGGMIAADRSRYLLSCLGHAYGGEWRARPNEIESMVAFVKKRGPVTVRALRAALPTVAAPMFERTLVYLAKLDVIDVRPRRGE